MSTEQKARQVEAALVNQCPFEFIAEALRAGITQRTSMDRIRVIIEKAAWLLCYVATHVGIMNRKDASNHFTIEITLQDPDSTTSLRGELVVVLSKGSANAWVTVPPVWNARA